ncbi:hypothetical protein DH2020_041367 [Rehmannia glutinosa]|uniref:3'-5' exonuclease domain-containing protein n=1 Tax=Rehmannia glutinosa TaxID=99300 RepID=A0ABR0UR01_REHGL
MPALIRRLFNDSSDKYYRYSREFGLFLEEAIFVKRKWVENSIKRSRSEREGRKLKPSFCGILKLYSIRNLVSLHLVSVIYLFQTTMKIRIKDHKLPFNSHKLYSVLVDDDDEIETLVTHDASMVKSWIGNVEYSHQCRLHRLIVGLDVEWRPNFTDSCDHPVATLQLSVGNSCLIFQILHATRIPRRLREFLGDPDYTFVGVGIKNDVEMLWDDYGLEVANKRDLRSWAAVELERKELRKFGLKALVKEVIGAEMEKPNDITLSRWDNLELSRRQVGYACLDAYFSFEIGRVLSSWY